MAKTDLINIDDLELDDENARAHDDQNLGAIRKSLETFGSGRSIVVDGNNIIRAGNGTIEAARDAGFEQVLIVEPEPGQIVAVRRGDWSEQEAKGYGVADNRAAELATWNLPALKDIIESTRDAGIEAIGFTSEQLEAMLGEFDVPEGSMPDLDPKDPEHTQMSFVLTADQALMVGEALTKAIEAGEATPGKKGQALAAVCEAYLEG